MSNNQYWFYLVKQPILVLSSCQTTNIGFILSSNQYWFYFLVKQPACVISCKSVNNQHWFYLFCGFILSNYQHRFGCFFNVIWPRGGGRNIIINMLIAHDHDHHHRHRHHHDNVQVYTKMMQSGLEEGVAAVERERARVTKIISDKVIKIKRS